MKFRKKPVIIEALRFDGSNFMEVLDWVGSHATAGPRLAFVDAENKLRIRTLESGDGSHIADSGDWIIRGVKGEFYPCKPDIFAATYEPAEEAASA